MVQKGLKDGHRWADIAWGEWKVALACYLSGANIDRASPSLWTVVRRFIARKLMTALFQNPIFSKHEEDFRKMYGLLEYLLRRMARECCIFIVFLESRRKEMHKMVN